MQQKPWKYSYGPQNSKLVWTFQNTYSSQGGEQHFYKQETWSYKFATNLSNHMLVYSSETSYVCQAHKCIGMKKLFIHVKYLTLIIFLKAGSYTAMEEGVLTVAIFNALLRRTERNKASAVLFQKISNASFLSSC